MCLPSKCHTKFRASPAHGPPLLPCSGPLSSHRGGAGPCCTPSCPYEPQLLKKWSQKKQPIKTETAVTILHSMILISLSFVFLPLFACSFSLSLSSSIFHNTTPSGLGPEMEQGILSPSANPCHAEIRLKSILNHQLPNTQSQGRLKQEEWVKNPHQRQVQSFLGFFCCFFFSKTE